MKTTLDIDDPILQEVKSIQEAEGRSLGAVVSELLAEALSSRRRSSIPPAFRWHSRALKALVDLDDKEAVYTQMPGTGPGIA